MHTELAASGGSALVGFVQAGGGSTLRTAQDKLRDFVSVKDFGAKGDGITDDTVAIQKALTDSATTGGAILFPSGTYILSSTLTISDKPIVLLGQGMEVTILKWTGVGMVGANGITYTNAVAQVPFIIQDMSLVGVPNPASASTLAGVAVSVTYPSQVTVYATTVHLDRVYVRPAFTGNTWNPTNVGGWTTCVYTSDAGISKYTDCYFVCNTNVNVTLGISIYSTTNPDYVVMSSCSFSGFFTGILTGGPSSFGGLVVEACNFVGCNIALNVSIAADLIQVVTTYIQAFTQGIRSLARTSIIKGNRFDIVPDPFFRYTPATAEAIVLGNGIFGMDGCIIDANQFGGNATTKNGIHLTAAVTRSVIRNNVIGSIAAFGTAYGTGVLLDSGTTNNTASGNTKVAATCLIADNGSNNYVFGNLPLEGLLGLTGATPALKSGIGNVTLSDMCFLSQGGATTVTNILNGYAGQRITLVANDANSTIATNANIHLNGGTNFVMAGNATLSLLFDGVLWRETTRTTS
jgi:hypothetical protein